jgi:hypothetical protein
MKKLLKYLLLPLALICSLGSCSFLDVEEHGKSDTDTFFASMEGLRTALPGLYSVTYDFYDQYLYKYAEVAGDALQASAVGSGSDMYYQYNFLSTPDLETTAVGYLWKKGFIVITNANTILNYTDGLKSSYPAYTAEIESIEAQALFLRALAHFDLLHCYAQPYGYTADASHLGISVVTHVLGTSERLKRNTVREVYAQIIKDLQAAQAILGDDAPTDAHYISGMACNALLARVYLYMGDYAQAEAYADKVLGNMTLTPRADYAAMFTGEKLGEEAILRLTGYAASNRLRTFYNYESPIYVPTSEFRNLFEPSDIRLTLLNGPNGDNACMKYYDLTGASSSDQYYNLTILRGAELYLIRAEARCRQGELNGANDDLHAVRARALGVTASSLASYTTASSLMEQIKLERQRELCFEGHRFFDLARWGDDVVRSASTNSSMKTLNYPDYRYVLPIPQVEMDANEAMEQNEGYN